MANIKTIGTIAVIVGCFAIIYPRFMHPMVLRMFGMQSVATNQADSTFPPHMRGSSGPMHKERKPPMHPDPKDIRQHVRPGPHPGMRAAAEMQKQQSPGGGGRGMMGIVLPMYAVGICVYLVYTLVKVFNKRGQYQDPYSTKSKYDSNTDQQRLDSLGFPREMRGGQGEVQQFLQNKNQEKELEDLLLKMDDTRNVSEEEMRALQKRLEDTEAQMTRILAAMHTMQSRIVPAGTSGGGAANAEAPDDVETVARAGEGADAVSTEEQKADNASINSSPSTESFEMVKNRDTSSAVTTPSEASSASTFSQLDGMKGECMEGEEEEAEKEGEDGGTEELIESKPQDKESSVRHRKTGNMDED